MLLFIVVQSTAQIDLERIRFLQTVEDVGEKFDGILVLNFGYVVDISCQVCYICQSNLGSFLDSIFVTCQSCSVSVLSTTSLVSKKLYKYVRKLFFRSQFHVHGLQTVWYVSQIKTIMVFIAALPIHCRYRVYFATGGG